MLSPKWILGLSSSVVLISGPAAAPSASAGLDEALPLATPEACAGTWEVVPTPEVEGRDTLLGVAAVSDMDVWAVGEILSGIGFSSRTLIEHWDGLGWTVVDSPNPGNGKNALKDVVALSANDVWAVGDYSEGAQSARTLIVHWDGSEWTVVPSPNVGTGTNTLWGLTAISPTDIWTVGQAFAGPYRTLALHWDGASWTTVRTPHSRDESWLYDVAGLSSTDIWAVGIGTQALDAPRRTLAVHWDGASWERIRTPSPGPSSADLLGVAGSNTTDVWAVGYSWNDVHQAHLPLLVHWDGIEWSVIKAPRGDDGWNQLNGVASLGLADAWAVGYSSPRSLNPDSTLVEHWDGSSWSVVPSPNGTFRDSELLDVAADSQGSVWAVGTTDNFDTQEGAALVERCG